jgi:hypothetical protein
MPGFLSALFAVPADGGDSASDHDGAGAATALDPGLDVHTGESGTAHHADGSVTDWSASQDLGFHADLGAATQIASDDPHQG